MAGDRAIGLQRQLGLRFPGGLGFVLGELQQTAESRVFGAQLFQLPSRIRVSSGRGFCVRKWQLILERIGLVRRHVPILHDLGGIGSKA